MQEFDGAAFYYRPNFNDSATPFRDVRDFNGEDSPTYDEPVATARGSVTTA